MLRAISLRNCGTVTAAPLLNPCRWLSADAPSDERPRKRLINRFSRYYAPLTREIPADVVAPSHNLMLRSGMMRKSSNGVFTYLPMGVKVLARLQALIYDELSVQRDCARIQMPLLLPADIWKKSGRWDSAGEEMFRLKDRQNDDYCLGPTHEECVTDLVTREVWSYKDLPLKLYQMGIKYRDEIRPRFGILRAREFLMKDLYTFDKSPEDALKTYMDIGEAYTNILERLQLVNGKHFVRVKADSGNIGGNLSEEFHLLSELGEDKILSCPKCFYAANVELASAYACPLAPPQKFINMRDLLRGVSISDASDVWLKVAAFLRREGTSRGLTLSILRLVPGATDGDVFPARNLVIVRNKARELNEIKIRRHFALIPEEMEPVPIAATDDATVQSLLSVESADHIRNLPGDLANAMLYVDVSEQQALEKQGLSVPGSFCGDFTTCTEVDSCSYTRTGLEARRGTEVGHIFYLGTKYSIPMKAMYYDSEKNLKPMDMGCFGIGVSRLMAGVIDIFHDSDGIRWPKEIAPFRFAVVNGKARDAATTERAESLYDSLCRSMNVSTDDVLFDDRDESRGRKVQDMYLMGVPLLVVVRGTGDQKDTLEVLVRNTGKRVLFNSEQEMRERLPELLKESERL